MYICVTLLRGIVSDTQLAIATAHALSRIEKTGIVLKSQQVQAIHQVRIPSVFLRLQTGFGKSICYEVLLNLSVAL